MFKACAERNFQIMKLLVAIGIQSILFVLFVKCHSKAGLSLPKRAVLTVVNIITCKVAVRVEAVACPSLAVLSKDSDENGILNTLCVRFVILH